MLLPMFLSFTNPGPEDTSDAGAQTNRRFEMRKCIRELFISVSDFPVLHNCVLVEERPPGFKGQYMKSLLSRNTT